MCCFFGGDKLTVKSEDVVFWLLTLAVLGIVIWLLHGSPTLEDALLSITALILSSEFMLWKKYYAIDKNTAVSFMRFKNNLDQLRKGQEMMQHSLENITSILRNRK